jgi:repressor LexA
MLTSRQKEILDYIIERVKEAGYPPTVREIAMHFKVSIKGAYDHLVAVEKKGYIKRDPTKPRAIELLDFVAKKLPYKVVEVPIVGRVAAGEPLLAAQNIEGTLPISSEVVNSEEVFALKIKGTSMIEDGILDGDYVIVKQQNSAQSGDIVVALLEDEATVKRFYKEDSYVRLQPSNSQMAPIKTKNVKVLGKVIGVFRQVK